MILLSSEHVWDPFCQIPKAGVTCSSYVLCFGSIASLEGILC